MFLVSRIHRNDGSLLYQFDKEYNLIDLYTKKLQRCPVLRDANLKGSIWARMSIVGLNFSNANLSCSNFSEGKLSGICFAGADLSMSSFANAVLIGVDFTDAKIDGTSLRKAHLENCLYNGRLINASHSFTGQSETAFEVLSGGAKGFEPINASEC